MAVLAAAVAGAMEITVACLSFRHWSIPMLTLSGTPTSPDRLRSMRVRACVEWRRCGFAVLGDIDHVKRRSRQAPRLPDHPAQAFFSMSPCAVVADGRSTRESSMSARIGLIIPASNRMVEQEMVRHVPPGVAAHVHAAAHVTGEHRGDRRTRCCRALWMRRSHLLDARRGHVVDAFHCTANSTSEAPGR